MESINATSVKKSFPGSHRPAIDKLDLTIQAGESVAFLGPNGAGKSTTIKLLCGILQPDEGKCSIMGHPSGSKMANQLLGVVFGARSQLHFNMTVRDSLELLAEAYFVFGNQKQNRIALLAEMFESTSLLDKRVRTLSLGERMRCEIISSLLHSPQVILLDEPTIGLDIRAKTKFRESLRTWQREEKTTMLLTSHDLSDVQALCDRCVLINFGQKSYDGPLKGVKGDLGEVRRVRLLLNLEGTSDSHHEVEVPSKMHRLPSESQDEIFYEYSLQEIATSEVLKYLSLYYGERILDIQLAEVSLEEVIHKHYSTQPSP